MTKEIIKSGIFSLGSLGGDGASTTRPTRRWGGITGRSLVTASDTLPTTGVLSLAEHYTSRFNAWKADIEYMIIAGGGSGGWHHGGGGGAGGVLYGGAGSVTYTGPFTLTVGAGGPQNTLAPGDTTATKGDNSAAFGLTAIGGGGGGSNKDGGDGGSGGGEGGYDDSGNTAVYGNPTAGQGYRGGRNSPNTPSYTNIGSGGGGGGAGGVGGDCKGTVSTRAGYGGIGITNAFLDDLLYGQLSSGSYYVAGGGGAGGWNGFVSNGLGGTGGGGDGGYNTTVPSAGSAGFGGGGGGRQQGNSYQGAAGGSGAVLIRVPQSVSLTSGTLTIPTPTYSKTGYKDYKFTTVGSGTVSIVPN